MRGFLAAVWPLLASAVFAAGAIVWINGGSYVWYLIGTAVSMPIFYQTGRRATRRKQNQRR